MLNAPPGTLKLFLYHIFTLGLYFIYWCVKSRKEIHRSAGKELINTPWIIAIPGLVYWWIWQYVHALSFVSYGRIKASDSFLVFVLCTFMPLIIYSQVGAFIPDDTDNSISEETAKTILIISSLVFIFIEIIGLAAYCSYMQGKINKLKK